MISTRRRGASRKDCAPSTGRVLQYDSTNSVHSLLGEEPSEIARTIIESLDQMGDKQVDFGDGNAAGITCHALVSFIKDWPKPSW